MIDEKIYLVEEVTQSDDTPFRGVKVEGKNVFRLSEESEWEIETVLTDYPESGPREKMVVVFKRVEKDEGTRAEDIT